MSTVNVDKNLYSDFNFLKEIRGCNPLNEKNSIQTNFNCFPEFSSVLNDQRYISSQLNSDLDKSRTYSCFDAIKEIHLELTNSTNLSLKEKLKICRIERNYMKMYLKDILYDIY